MQCRSQKFTAKNRVLIGAAFVFASGSCVAQSWSGFGSIKYIEAGWSQDTMAVYHSAPTVNPNGCRVTSAGYATDPADPGRSLFHTVALAAFLNRKEVQLLISGCVFDKPKIIAVGIR